MNDMIKARTRVIPTTDLKYAKSIYTFNYKIKLYNWRINKKISGLISQIKMS